MGVLPPRNRMRARIEARVDPAARLLVISVVGDVPDDAALHDVPRIWERHPEIVDYDSVIDLTRDAGRISWDAIGAIAERWRAFAGGHDRGRRTAIVVRDRQWATYAEAIAAMFAPRTFKIFRTVAEARAWLGDRGAEPG